MLGRRGGELLPPLPAPAERRQRFRRSHRERRPFVPGQRDERRWSCHAQARRCHHERQAVARRAPPGQLHARRLNRGQLLALLTLIEELAAPPWRRRLFLF